MFFAGPFSLHPERDSPDLWSSPVGLGFSTRLAQAADSLSGERTLTSNVDNLLHISLLTALLENELNELDKFKGFFHGLWHTETRMHRAYFSSA